MQKKIINQGSGPQYREDSHNVDLSGKCDEIYDLTKMPWPWDDEQFEEVIAEDIIEHLSNTIGFIDECHRILKLGGYLKLRTPAWDAPFLWIDPTHIRGYDLDSSNFFDPTTEYGKYNNHLTDRKWKIVSKEIINHNVVVEMVKL